MIKKRAQLSPTDVLIAVFIFAILITFILVFWYNYNQKLIVKLEREVIFSQAIEITDNFVKTLGKPNNWDETNVEIIGLASSDRKISEEKVQKFCNISYDSARQLLTNLMYHFHFSIEEDECGIVPPENATKIVTLERPVIYKNNTALLKFSLWR